jgi:hypothetical protein
LVGSDAGGLVGSDVGGFVVGGVVGLHSSVGLGAWPVLSWTMSLPLRTQWASTVKFTLARAAGMSVCSATSSPSPALGSLAPTVRPEMFERRALVDQLLTSPSMSRSLFVMRHVTCQFPFSATHDETGTTTGW